MFASAFLALAIVDSVVAAGMDSTSPNGEFQFRSYNQILQHFENLQRKHPAIVKIFDALDQDKWRDAIAPNVADARLPQCGANRCKWLVVHITNHAAYNALTPEMYISGCLHGNEQVGPNVATEYASFLADEYVKNNTQIRHLLNTRSLWMTPMTNAWGYFSNSRNEKGPNDAEANGIDSNRDFPYNDYYEDGNKSCMKSIAARVIAELYKRQMILVSLTLHSGIETVSYLWGSLPHATAQTDAKEIQEVHEWLRSKGVPQHQFQSHCHKDCTKQNNFCCKSLDAPDLSAYKAIGDSIWLAYGTTANDACGRQKGSGFEARGYERENYEGCWYFPKPLPATDDVYAVNGGLEDFSYAYSWERRIDTEKESPAYTNPIPSKCSSDRYGGYTMIAENWKQSVKQLNYLIELTDKKDEKQNYGHRSQVFRPSPNDGHIARNIRAFIRVLELLHPEVVLDLNSNSIYGIGCRKIEAKLVKVDDPNLCSSQSSQMVDSSQIGRLQTVHDFKVNKCRGLQLWRSKEEDDQFPDSGIKLPDSLEVGKCYAIVASFDQEWANQAGSAPRPRVSPQSHLVRARTNDKYEVANAAVNAGSRIEAKKYHFRPFMIKTSKAKQACADKTPEKCKKLKTSCTITGHRDIMREYCSVTCGFCSGASSVPPTPSTTATPSGAPIVFPTPSTQGTPAGAPIVFPTPSTQGTPGCADNADGLASLLKVPSLACSHVQRFCNGGKFEAVTRQYCPVTCGVCATTTTATTTTTTTTITGRGILFPTSPSAAQVCSKLQSGWEGCEKQNANCKTRYHPWPAECVSKTSGSSRSAAAEEGRSDAVVPVVIVCCVVAAAAIAGSIFVYTRKATRNKQGAQE